MHVLGSLNNTLVAQFNKERMAYARGERSLRNYKRDIPVPFKAEDIKNLRRREDNRNFTFSLFGIPFKTYLGRDFTDKPLLLEEVCEGRIRLCSGAMRPEKGKLFWFAYFEKQKETKNLDENVFAEASLSIETPIVLKIGKFTYLIGNKEEFLYRRLAIQAARQRLQFSIKHNGGGHGRKRKMQPLEVFNTREKNYTEHKMHLYSKKLIDICLKHHVATIILTFQQDKETVAKEDPFILRNWSYYSLKEKIKYKAQRVGMAVITE
jgi:IS605 OrfB family transposase